MSRSRGWLVARREVTERFHGRALWIQTAVSTALVVALVVVPRIVGDQSKATVVALATPAAQGLRTEVAALAAAAKVPVRIEEVGSPADASAAVNRGAVDVALFVDEGGAKVEVRQTVSPQIRAILDAAVNTTRQAQVLRDAGVGPSTLRALAQRTPVPVVALEPAPKDKTARSVGALAAGFLLYFSLGIWGSTVANSAAQEKASRTAEVLLASMRPTELLSGKVAGVGICAFTQLAITVIVGLVANAAAQAAAIPNGIWRLLPIALLWFVIGYCFFSVAYAAAGATVARQEEVQLATAPFQVMLTASMALTYSAIFKPNAAWVRVLSFVPVFSPVLMPVRFALGHLAVWEMPVALVVAVVAAVGMMRVGAQVYASALMRGGPRISWKMALAAR